MAKIIEALQWPSIMIEQQGAMEGRSVGDGTLSSRSEQDYCTSKGSLMGGGWTMIIFAMRDILHEIENKVLDLI